MVDNPYSYPYVPIGGIIEWDGTGMTGAPDLSTPEKVAAVYGYGTWERYGTDRVTVGAGGDYAAGSIGGEKAHALTVDETASHNHPQSLVLQNAYAGETRTWDFITYGYLLKQSDTANPKADSYTGKCTVTNAGFTRYTGGNQPHNNMQPYIGTYRYRRIA